MTGDGVGWGGWMLGVEGLGWGGVDGRGVMGWGGGVVGAQNRK